jgi:hypothetical protein
MANNLTITTPRGKVFTVTLKNGSTKAALEWAPDFGSRYTGNFTRAQQFIDSEVLRHCDPLVPKDTGMLKTSGIIGTVVGSGEVSYIAPYSAYQYYKTAQSRPYDANRGGKWFERMKAVHKDAILRGALKIAGGGR